MSVYKNNSPDALKDYHEVRDYILGINKAVQNVFNSLEPDDNFTEEELKRYNEAGKRVAMVELSSSDLRILFEDTEKTTAATVEQTKEKLSLKVRSGDVVNQMNLEHGDIVVWGGESRLFYHGIQPLKAGFHPMTGEFRYNLTFRQAAEKE